MAVPKQKLSKSKTRRRKHCGKALKAPNISKCPQCGSMTMPHRVCSTCGYYKKKKVIQVEEA